MLCISSRVVLKQWKTIVPEKAIFRSQMKTERIFDLDMTTGVIAFISMFNETFNEMFNEKRIVMPRTVGVQRHRQSPRHVLKKIIKLEIA